MNQPDLFGDEGRDQWIGMPEFVQEKREPFSEIVIRFETEEDLKEFGEIIGQKLTPLTKSIWHPHKPHKIIGKKVWRYE